MTTVNVSQPLAIGVIGTGRMGARHADNLYRWVGGARLAAVCDQDEPRARQAAAQGGDALVFTDPAALIADERVAAVVIASPDDTHAGLTLACLQAGKPVLCEKPLGLRPADAHAIVAAETALGRRLVSVGFMRRFDPAHTAVKTLAHSGEIGRPLLLKGTHRNPVVPAGTSGATVLTNSAVHDFDSARWFMEAEVQAVSVHGRRSRPDLHPDARDLLLITLQLSDERLAVAEVFVNAGYGYEVTAEVVCQSGTAHTLPPERALLRGHANRGVPLSSDWLAPFQAAYVAEMRAWVEAVQAGRPFAGAGAWDGYAAAVITAAGIQSLSAGGAFTPVDLPARPALYA